MNFQKCFYRRWMFTLNKMAWWFSKVVRKVNTDEVKEMEYPRGHYFRKIHNFCTRTSAIFVDRKGLHGNDYQIEAGWIWERGWRRWFDQRSKRTPSNSLRPYAPYGLMDKRYMKKKKIHVSRNGMKYAVMCQYCNLLKSLVNSVSIKSTADCGLRTADCGLALRTGYKTWTEYKMKTKDHELGIKLTLSQTAES